MGLVVWTYCLFTERSPAHAGISLTRNQMVEILKVQSMSEPNVSAWRVRPEGNGSEIGGSFPRPAQPEINRECSVLAGGVLGRGRSVRSIQ